jgi:PAS domain S-box-containing protein
MTIDELRRERSAPVVIANHNGIITYVNARFEAEFGWSAPEIIGKPLAVIIPHNLHDAHHLGFSRFVTSGVPTLLNQPLVLKAVDKAGREFEAEHTIVAEQERGQWVFGATIRPLQPSA